MLNSIRIAILLFQYECQFEMRFGKIRVMVQCLGKGLCGARHVAFVAQNIAQITTKQRYFGINLNGAFYRPQGQLIKVGQESGPPRTDRTRPLTVGNYGGDTLPAQVTTLLHELGHIIDLLPEDADNLDGKSVLNTDEVLRHCRTEVEARPLQARRTAKQ